jgi:hypothetical protein
LKLNIGRSNEWSDTITNFVVWRHRLNNVVTLNKYAREEIRPEVR